MLVGSGQASQALINLKLMERVVCDNCFVLFCFLAESLKFECVLIFRNIRQKPSVLHMCQRQLERIQHCSRNSVVNNIQSSAEYPVESVIMRQILQAHHIIQLSGFYIISPLVHHQSLQNLVTHCRQTNNFMVLSELQMQSATCYSPQFTQLLWIMLDKGSGSL